MSASDQDVLMAAEELGEELRNAQQEQSRFEFNSLLIRCNDAIDRESSVDYGDACGAGDGC